MGTPLTFDVNATVKDEDGKPILGEDEKPQRIGGTISYDFGDNLAECVDKFGEDVVFSNCVAQGKVRVQGVARTAIESGKTLEEAQEKVNGYVLGTAPVRSKKDHFEAYKAQFQGADPKEQERMIKELAASVKKQ